jgi:uncharacterized protein (DUF1778 family)
MTVTPERPDASDAAQDLVIDTGFEQQRITLAAADYEAFLELLANPPPPDAKLRALMKRKPVWEA